MRILVSIRKIYMNSFIDKTRKIVFNVANEVEGWKVSGSIFGEDSLIYLKTGEGIYRYNYSDGSKVLLGVLDEEIEKRAIFDERYVYVQSPGTEPDMLGGMEYLSIYDYTANYIDRIH